MERHDETSAHYSHMARPKRRSQCKTEHDKIADITVKITLKTRTTGVSYNCTLTYSSAVFRPPRSSDQPRCYLIKEFTGADMQQYTNFSEIKKTNRIASAECEYLKVIIFTSKDRKTTALEYAPTRKLTVNHMTSEQALYPISKLKLLEVTPIETLSQDELIGAYFSETDPKALKREFKQQEKIVQKKALARLAKLPGFGMPKVDGFINPSKEIMDGGSTTSPDSV